jgi:hypothetical protein
MGRQQFYKGNPELKQYFLVNDFSGGINTTDVDERTSDNEFRELLNVELIRTGMIQNRKGWGEVSLLNLLLEEKQITLPRFDTQSASGEFADRYALIKVVKNNGNLLTVLDNLEEQNLTTEQALIEFNKLNLVYELDLLLIYEVTNPNGVKISVLTLSNDASKDGITEIYTLAGTQFDDFKLLSNIETVEYTDYLYFSLSQLKSNLKGLFEYNTVTKDYRIVRDDEELKAFIYKPTPYEVSKIGFNVLSKTPLTDVEEQVGFLSITGLFLTTYQIGQVNNTPTLIDTQVPVTNFPQDGKVTLNVLYTGENVTVDDFTVEFYVMGTNLTTGLPEERPVDFTLDATALEATSGISRFACTVEVKNNPTIYIRVKLLSGVVFAEKVITRSFASVNGMVAFFNPALNTKFAVADGTSRFVLYNKTNIPYQYELQTGFSYNPGDNVQTFSPIYNDLNITSVNRWEEITVNAAAAYAAATNKNDVLKTNTFDEFTNMNAGNVPTNATGLSVGYILRVQKSKYVLGSPRVVSAFQVSKSVYDAAVNKGGYAYQQSTSSGCDFSYNPPTTTAVANVFKDSGVNGQVIQAYATAITGTVTNLTTGVTTYTYGICTNSLYYYQLNVTEATSNYFEDASPIEYKYFRVVAPSAELANPIVTYNSNDSKLYYRFGTDKTPIDGTVNRLNTINDRIPKSNELYLADITTPLVETNYYRYNKGVAGDETDFSQAVFVTAADTSIYTDIYNVGSNPGAKKIESLDLSGFRLIEISNRLVLYKQNIIWFSDLYQFDYVPNYNYIILPLTADDFITGIHYFKGSYMIFTKERIYKMSGTFGAPDFQIQIVSDAIGCISPYSIKPFNNTIVFMTHDGLYKIKQNYYQGGLENVEKIDKQLDGITPTNVAAYAFLYNEQYILMYDYKRTIGENQFNVLKMYYNMSAPNGVPYVKDRYSIMPKIVAKLDNGLYSLRYGKFYKYDRGYVDFLPPGEITDTVRNQSLFTTKIRTHKISFGYPTHDKKFKSIIIKDIANEPVPLLFDIYINNIRVYKSADFQTVINDQGQIDYVLVAEPYTIGATNLVGDFQLNVDPLGDISARVHKITFSGRGKDIMINIERKTAQQFSIQDIGYVYKVGKAREDR